MALKFSRLHMAFITAVGLMPAAYGQTDVTRRALDSLMGTIFVTPSPTFANGRLEGCGFEYAAFTKDFVYRSGGYIRVNGSFNLMKVKTAWAVTLKIILSDYDLATGEYIPSAPADAYFIDNYKTTKSGVVASTPSDQPGSLFVVMRQESALPPIFEALKTSKITIAFARTPGGIDIKLPLELDVEKIESNGTRVRSNKAIEAFISCSIELMEANK